MTGRYCRVEPLEPDRHAEQLYDANRLDRAGRNWSYLPYGPFDEYRDYRAWMEAHWLGDDPFFHAIIDSSTGKAVGVAAYLRVDRANGVIEVGHLNYSPLLQRRAAATEAMYLMMRRAFDELGYRRYEWKCNALNNASRSAAERLGFTFEGIFRQAMVVRGRNRDHAWYAVLDGEWPQLRRSFERWLAPANFDGSGVQLSSLSDQRL